MRRAQSELYMEKIVKFLYECGGACPVKFALRAIRERFVQTNNLTEQLRSAKKTLVKRGYIKPGTHARPENLPYDQMLEVATGVRSPYGMWELTKAGEKLAKELLYY